IVAPQGKEYLYNIANETDLAEVGGAVRKEFPEINAGRGLNIVRISQTQFLIVSAVCTHEGCTVDLPGDNAENSPDMVCPCHLAKFSKTTGKVLRTPGVPINDLTVFENTYDASTTTITIKY
ncbi:MAG TPA: Rieske (2Fe-2S) protein, partial [Patescibacteria group bacterium]|nr:Rieske (2Fe-2S) protein [Patescibacteria group bacterium]